MANENNVRTLDFSKEVQVMPEDIFEGAPEDFDFTGAEPQFTQDDYASAEYQGENGGTLVTADFTPVEEEEPLTAVELMHSRPFFYVQIPSLGIEAPLDVDTAISLFDALGAAINEL